MKKMRRTKIRLEFLLGLVVMGALAACSSFSPVVFAKSMVDRKRDAIVTEVTAPKMLDSQEERLKQKDEEPKRVSNNMDGEAALTMARDMTPEQKAPFVKMAKDAFKAKNIELPEKGYKVISRIISSGPVSKYIEIYWYPVNFDSASPVRSFSGKVYHVKIIDVDLNKGIGTVLIATVIERSGDLLGEREENVMEAETPRIGSDDILISKQAAPFMKRSKEAFKAKGIELPQSGSWINSTK